MLKVDGLRKRYGELEVVRGVNLARGAVARASACSVPNGAGKTTTLRCCLGLTAPDSGTIELAGLPVPAQAREARARVGVVPQFDNLDPDFTVTENLIVYGRYFGLSRRQCAAQVERLLVFAGLTDKAKAPIDSLVGRHEATPDPGARHDQRSTDPLHGRADHGPRSRRHGTSCGTGSRRCSPRAGRSS